jgi:SAM-dependent methyltransferase
MDTQSTRRRLYPSIIDTDWLVLRGMRPAIEKFAAQAAGPGKLAVDFGCGTQPYRPIFESLRVNYRGADFSGSDIVIDDSGYLRFDDASADLVLSFQVLEHVRDVGRYLSEARRILRDDGWLILSTHGSWLYHPHPEDHRRWTRQGLLAELATYGFETDKCIPIVGPLAWTTLLRLTGAYFFCRRVPVIGQVLARILALVMNARGYLEDKITPDWVVRDNACVYVTLSRPVGRSR